MSWPTSQSPGVQFSLPCHLPGHAASGVIAHHQLVQFIRLPCRKRAEAVPAVGSNGRSWVASWENT